MQSTRLDEQIAITAQAKPIRVCYLLTKDNDSSEILNHIFQECYERWGGRHTLVIPLENGTINDKYFNWLQWFDADIIYAYSVLSDELAEKIDREVMPSVLYQHREARDQTPRYFFPRWDFRGLSSLSVLPMVRAARGPFAAASLQILDAYTQWQGDGFIADSFGIRSKSPGGMTVSGPMPSVLEDFASTLALTPTDAPENRWRMKKAAGEITSETELLSRMADRGAIITMSGLSAAFSTLNNPYDVHPWCRTFNLVIGDSFEDRISFWNGRLLYQQWQQEGLTSLRVPEEKLADNAFVESLVHFLTRQNYITPSGNSGQGYVTIRSATVEMAKLNALRDRLVAKHMQTTVEQIVSFSDCVPASDKLIRQEPWGADRPTQFVNHTKFTLDSPWPRHLTEVVPPPILRTGHWGVDIKLDRYNTESSFSNVTHWWKLPRRWEILRLFTSKGHSRVSHDGKIRIFPDIENQKQEFQIPDDMTAIRCLFSRRQYHNTSDRRHSVPLVEKYRYTEPSDKGRYLTGAIGLFGTIAAAYRVLSERYWQKVFMEMAAPSKNLTPEKLKEISTTLKKRMRSNGNVLTFNNAEQWTSLAHAVAGIAPKLKESIPSVGYEYLKEQRKKDLEALINEDQNLQAQREEILTEFESDLKNAIEARCLERVFTQGHRWRCRKCGHKNWFSIESMKAVLECEICKADRPIPADFRWDFYLNDFLAEGLREHGLMPVIWTLGHLQWNAKQSFYFTPDLGLYEEYPETSRDSPDVEIDICCVVDGQFIIGEVKESEREITDALGDGMVSLAKDVRPDKIVIACLDQSARTKLIQQAERIKPALAEIGCDVEPLILQSIFAGGSTCLP